MNKELLELLNKINKQKETVRELANSGKIDEAKAAKCELINMQAQFDLLADLEAEGLEDAKNQIKDGSVKTVVDQTKKVAGAFVNAIKARFGKYELSDEEKEIVNSMNEGALEDGGLTVPRDISTEIKELRRGEDALEDLVNVEHVSTMSGVRIIERNADQVPFDNVDEEEEFPEVSTPQFEAIQYKIKKKGGILKVTRELLEDTAENILGYLKRWITKKSKATRNFMIIKKIREITADAEIAIASLDGLKDIFNIRLDPAIALNAKVITNQDGFGWLDKLKNSDGKYVLQPDPTDATKSLLFGKYKVIKIGNKTLASKTIDGGYKIPIICGDLKEAITIFDRENMTIDISSVAGNLWSKDQTGIKVRERLDIQVVDEEAIIMAEVVIKTDLDDDGKYSQSELQAMTKEQIFAAADHKGYNMTTTGADKKDDIIADFLTQQG